jgi:flagellar basal-body rod protein FlgB
MPLSMIDTPQIAGVTRFLDLLAARDQLITSNLANIDTPGYRTVDLNFRQELEQAGGESELQYALFSPTVQQVRGLMERPDGNNVSMERESLLLAETQLRYNTGVQLLRAEFHRISSAIHEGGASS